MTIQDRISVPRDRNAAPGAQGRGLSAGQGRAWLHQAGAWLGARLQGWPLWSRFGWKLLALNLFCMSALPVLVLMREPVRNLMIEQQSRLAEQNVRLMAVGLAGAQPGMRRAMVMMQAGTVPGGEVFYHAPDGELLEQASGPPLPAMAPPVTPLMDLLDLLRGQRPGGDPQDGDARDRALIEHEMMTRAMHGEHGVRLLGAGDRGLQFMAIAPVGLDGGSLILRQDNNTIATHVRVAREQFMWSSLVVALVMVLLSSALARNVVGPLRLMVRALEQGGERGPRRPGQGRVSLPDLSARKDEIGRLSEALRGMTGALYDRVDLNEQFAADVAHEIKNPLASLRSAVGSLQMVKREDHRQRLLEVIEHDVRRLDRLVSDISNASRLDSELVREEEEEFDLLRTLEGINTYMAQDAAEKGVDYITDMPPGPIRVHGLEARMAQVFVNLIANAISFCQRDDAVRVWVRRREGRILIVVEDTGPGIPETALEKVFERFYSERPASEFGEHSGLGLAISRQIVEAHGGVIWAENIQPTGDDPQSSPLGARFVVGLPA